MKRLAKRTGSWPIGAWLVTVAMILATPVQDMEAQVVDQRPRGSTLRVTLVDAVFLHEDVQRAVKDELDRILRPHGVSLETVEVDRSDAENSAGEASAGGIIKVLILPRDGSAWGVPGNAMGAAPNDSGRVTSGTVYVFHPVILEALKDGKGARRQPLRLELGRAIGRVIVHELVHAVAPGQPHAERGIMAGELGRPQLRGPGRTLDAASGRALRQALRQRLAVSREEK